MRDAMLTLTHLLYTFGAVALWAGSLYVRPFGRCWRCLGQGRIMYGPKPGKTQNGKRARPRKIKTCPACKGVKRRQRTGSRIVHRLARRVARELNRQRQQRAPLSTPKE